MPLRRKQNSIWELADFPPSYSLIVSFLLIVLIIAVFTAAGDSVVPDMDESKDTQRESMIVLPPEIDEITLKQIEMRDTVIMVYTISGTGSGTIIDRAQTGDEGVFEYRVLTNSHVTNSRLITYLIGVDSLTGKLKVRTIDTGCFVVVFDHYENNMIEYGAKIIVENIEYDVAILSFTSSKDLPVANIASNDMLGQIRVFDEVFAIGCQLGVTPTPTVGIVSRLIEGNQGEKQWIIYCNTAQIIYGSSGGGLFRKYGDHYYLIGIPFRASMCYSGQLITHLAQAISISTAREFINQSVTVRP